MAIYTLTLDNLILGSTLSIREAGTSNVLAQAVDHGAESFAFNYSADGMVVDILVSALGFAPWSTRLTLPAAHSLIEVDAALDRSQIIPVSRRDAARQAIGAVADTDPRLSNARRAIVMENTAAGWTSSGTVLETGVIGRETDTGKLKIGDGSSAWSALPYSGGGDAAPVAWADVTGKPSTFPPNAHTHPATDISDSTTTGRALVTAADAAAGRTALALGNVATRNVGTSAGQVRDAADPAYTNARTPTAHTHPASAISDSTTTGRALVTAADAAAGRTALALGDSATRNVGTTAGTVAAGDDSRITSAVQTSRQVATQHSLTGGGDLAADRTLSLVGDTASPGNNKVYGTDGSGVRGWKPDPAGGGSPGGSGTEFQYRIDGTTFGGIAGTSWDSANSIASYRFDGIGGTLGTPTTQGLRLRNETASTVSQSQFSPRLNFAATGWRTTATAASRPVEFDVYIQTRNAPNNPASALVFRPLVNGSLVPGVGFSAIATGDGYPAGTYITGLDGGETEAQFTTGWCGIGPVGAGNTFGFYTNTGRRVTVGITHLTMNGGVSVTWAAAETNTAGDTRLSRDSAGRLGLRNGTNAKAFGVYNTESGSLANFERLNFEWVSNVAYIRPTAAGTGTLRPMIVGHPPVTLATLPSASAAGAGSRSFISDATATTFASVAAGGGSNNVPVYSDGTDWRIG